MTILDFIYENYYELIWFLLGLLIGASIIFFGSTYHLIIGASQ